MKESKEIIDLVKSAVNGNEDSFKEILRLYERCIYSIISNFTIEGHNIDDLRSLAHIHIWKSLKSFDRAKGTLFSFIYTVVKRKILVLLASSLCKCRHTDNLLSLNYVGSNGETVNELIPAKKEKSYDDQEEYEYLEKHLVNILSELETKIYKYYVKGYSYDETGDKWQIDNKSVDNGMIRIRFKAKKLYNEYIEKGKIMTEEEKEL